MNASRSAWFSCYIPVGRRVKCPKPDSEVSEILAACAGTRIEQTTPAAEGTSLLISADVNVEGITRVSQAEYDERNDVWTRPGWTKNCFLRRKLSGNCRNRRHFWILRGRAVLRLRWN